MDIPGLKTIPYNEDYSLMIYQNDIITNDTYLTTTGRFAVYGENNNAFDTINGEFNTENILNTTSATNTVAKLCNDLSITIDSITYNDWYLPSIDEITAIYNAGYINYVDFYLWTSTELNTSEGYCIDCGTGIIVELSKSTFKNTVPVRKVYLSDYVTIDRMSLLSKNADILRGGEYNADEDVYKMLGGVYGVSKNSKILSNE